MRPALLAVLCLRVTADDGSLLQVQTGVNDFEAMTIEDANRMQVIAEKTGFEMNHVKSIFANATSLMRQRGGPPRSFRDIITEENLEKAHNHPLSKFFAMKSNSDQIKHELDASARNILKSLKASHNSSSGESTLKNFVKSNENHIQRFLFSADGAVRSRSTGVASTNCALYLPNHKYTLKFYLKGLNGCANRMAFRYRVQLKLDLRSCEYTFKGEDMSFFYKFKEDGTEIQWGDPIYWKGLANGFFVIVYRWQKAPIADNTCNGDITRWQLQVGWKINQANQQEGPRLGNCNLYSKNDAGVAMNFKWEDNVARGGYPMRFEDAEMKWSYAHGTNWLSRWNGKKGAESDFTVFGNQFVWGFAFAEVNAKPKDYGQPPDFPPC